MKPNNKRILRAGSRKLRNQTNKNRNNGSQETLVGERRYLVEIKNSIQKCNNSNNALRTSLSKYIEKFGDKAQLDKPHILLKKLRIDQRKYDMSFLYKMIHAVHVEFDLSLDAGTVPYTILASLPKKNPDEVWNKAKEIMGDSCKYPSENHIKEAKAKFKEDQNAAKVSKIDIEKGDENKPDLKQSILELCEDNPKRTKTIYLILKNMEIQTLRRIIKIKKVFSNDEVIGIINEIKEEDIDDIPVKHKPRTSKRIKTAGTSLH